MKITKNDQIELDRESRIQFADWISAKEDFYA